jgi:hypothetical protein
VQVPVIFNDFGDNGNWLLLSRAEVVLIGFTVVYIDTNLRKHNGTTPHVAITGQICKVLIVIVTGGVESSGGGVGALRA